MKGGSLATVHSHPGQTCRGLIFQKQLRKRTKAPSLLVSCLGIDHLTLSGAQDTCVILCGEDTFVFWKMVEKHCTSPRGSLAFMLLPFPTKTRQGEEEKERKGRKELCSHHFLFKRKRLPPDESVRIVHLVPRV